MVLVSLSVGIWLVVSDVWCAVTQSPIRPPPACRRWRGYASAIRTRSSLPVAWRAQLATLPSMNSSPIWTDYSTHDPAGSTNDIQVNIVAVGAATALAASRRSLVLR